MSLLALINIVVGPFAGFSSWRTWTYGRRSSAGSVTSIHDRLTIAILAQPPDPRPATGGGGGVSLVLDPLAVPRARTLGRRGWSVRYYICCDDRLAWRILDRLHRDLVAGTLALLAGGGTRQKVLEVFFRSTPGGQVLIRAYGSFYAFGRHGGARITAVSEAFARGGGGGGACTKP